MSQLYVRKVEREDVANLINIQAQCYPSSLHESHDTFEAIVNQGMSFLAIASDTLLPIGYILIHGLSSLSHPPCLNQSTDSNEEPDALFIHDLCILPQYQGMGYGTFLWKHAIRDITPCITHIACISLPHSIPFWKKQGFHDVACDEDIIKSYGKGASYLVRLRFT